jgi:Ca-activated chloride channel family protein
MLDFVWPWLILLLPAPWLVQRFARPADGVREAALRVPSIADFTLDAGGMARVAGMRGAAFLLALLGWLLLVLAAMRPQWVGDIVEVPVSGRDLMLAVDLSGSMQEEDFVLAGRRVDRLTATKAVAGQFIERRAGDRIGLILFGEQPYVQAPLTFDRRTVQTLLDESAIGLAGKATAIGDAIGLAVKRLRERDAGNRVLILLTDGANTAGAVEPLEAAELAANNGLRIHTIGIGADAMVVQGFFGTRRVNPSADLDEVTLKRIAELTGGRYFRARDAAELEQIYKVIDQLEPVAGDPEQYRPRRALFYWPLGLALLAAAALLALRARGMA